MESWKTLGRCHGMAPDVFFPEKNRWAEKTAKAICAGCPVEAQCMDYAIANSEVGVWGGTTERQRNKIRNRYVRPRGNEAIRKALARQFGEV
jgi:WhiB family transcriptional regulator, redox-sensing transcriptional regulator